MIRAIITLISVALFIYGLYENSQLIRICSKPVPILVLIWMTYSYKDKWLLGALGFSLLGDIILELPQFFPFAMGLASFLLAHILYIRRFLSVHVHKLWWPLIPITLYCGVLFSYMAPNLGALFIPVSIYVLVIAAMLWSASVYSYTQKNYLLILGAIFFVISDSLIAINKFISPFSQARYAIIITYWLAQYLIIIPLLAKQDHASHST